MSYVEEEGVGYMVCDNCGVDMLTGVTPAHCTKEDVCWWCAPIVSELEEGDKK